MNEGMEIGHKICIDILDDNDRIIEGNLASRFEGNDDNNIKIITAPYLEGVVLPIYPGRLVNLSWTLKNNMYMQKALIQSRGFIGNIPVLYLRMLDGTRKIQRRQFFRIEMNVEFKYRIVREGEEKSNLLKTYTKDIGGGGLCIRTKESVPDGEKVYCELTLGSQFVSFYGKVLRSKEKYMDSYLKYEVAIEFLQIDEREREQIIKHTFSMQRALRKKGLI